jgi:hypothetical protein
VKEGRPEWAEYLPTYSGLNQTFLAEVWIKPSAAMPLTVTGTTNVAFPCKTRTVELDVEGDKRKARAGPTTLQVLDADWQKDESHVRLRAEAADLTDIAERLSDSGLALIDAKGERHPGRIGSLTRRANEPNAGEWEIVFTGGIANPRKLTLQWVEEFHRVEIPFRLEGVRLPDLK